MDVHVGYLIKNIADKLHGRADANLKKHNLTFQQSKIIGFLALRNNEASQKEIENFLNEIQSEKFLKFLYNVIVSFKRQWGY